MPPAALAAGLQGVSLPGRCQLIPGRIQRVLDVAHNRASARQLAACLAEHPVAGETWLVLGMLADKDVAGLAALLAPVTDHWCLAGLPGERGLPAERLAAMAARGSGALQFGSVAEALAHVERVAADGDRVVVTGSFLTVAAAMATRV